MAPTAAVYAPKVRIDCGDALELLRAEPAASVQCVVTSPPYYGQRVFLPRGTPAAEQELGLEPSVDQYVGRLVAVFREVRRVLRPDGVVWLNLGDSYADGSTGGHRPGRHAPGRAPRLEVLEDGSIRRRPPAGMKGKDLMLVPDTVAAALRSDGWYLRSVVVWAKPDPLPERVLDRPVQSHEYLYLLSRSERYHYDAFALVEAGLPGGTVWMMPKEPSPDGHPATFPEALAERCILTGTAPRVCPACGAAWRRTIRKVYRDTGRPVERRAGLNGFAVRAEAEVRMAWGPSCACEGYDGSGRGVVLDPFCGSGTVPAVAARLGRDSVGFDLHPAYCARARRRAWTWAQPRLAL